MERCPDCGAGMNHVTCISGHMIDECYFECPECGYKEDCEEYSPEQDEDEEVQAEERRAAA